MDVKKQIWKRILISKILTRVNQSRNQNENGTILRQSEPSDPFYFRKMRFSSNKNKLNIWVSPSNWIKAQLNCKVYIYIHVYVIINNYAPHASRHASRLTRFTGGQVQKVLYNTRAALFLYSFALLLHSLRSYRKRAHSYRKTRMPHSYRK